MYVYTVLQERGKRGGEKRRGKSVRSIKSPSERRRVVRERDRVGARRLAVAVRAAGRALVDGPEHDAAHLSVEIGDDGLLVPDAAADARVGLRPRLAWRRDCAYQALVVAQAKLRHAAVVRLCGIEE